MTLNTIKFSQFSAGSLANNNYLVGVTSLSGGTNFQTPAVNRWTTSGRPVSPATGTLGYNTSLIQYEYWNGAAWVQLAAGGSGTVSLGGINELAYYAANGTTVTGLMTQNSSALITSSSGVPEWFIVPTMTVDTSSTVVSGSSDTLIIFTNTEYDSYSGYSSITGAYTIPVTGKYGAGTILHYDDYNIGSGGYQTVLLYKNGAGWQTLENTFFSNISAGTAGTVSHGYTELSCVAGDTLQIYARANNGGSTSTLNGSDGSVFFVNWLGAQ